MRYGVEKHTAYGKVTYHVVDLASGATVARTDTREWAHTIAGLLDKGSV